MFLWSVLIALAVGWTFGGRLARYEKARMRGLWMPFPAFLAQSLPNWVPAFSDGIPAAVGIVICYGTLALFLFQNRRLRKTFWFAGSGTLCNFLVIALNDFCMPVSQRVLSLLSEEGARALMAGEIPMYCAAGPDTRLLFLGDILPLPGGFASVGDLLLAVGAFFCILCLMRPRKILHWWIKNG